jgi:hypothetical protein
MVRRAAKKAFQQGTDLHHMAGVKLCPIYIHVFATVKSETIGFISPKASLMSKTPTGRLFHSSQRLASISMKSKGIYAILFMVDKDRAETHRQASSTSQRLFQRYSR